MRKQRLVQGDPERIEEEGERRSVEFFRASPEDALAGSKLASIEGGGGRGTVLKRFHRGAAIVELATECPARFLELVGYLPHAVEDVMLQHYLLGRTHKQIAETLGHSPSPWVWQQLEMGIEAMCAIIAWGGPPPERMDGQPRDERERRLYEAYRKMQAFAERDKGELRTAAPPNLGAFRISAADINLAEFFALPTQDTVKMAGDEC